MKRISIILSLCLLCIIANAETRAQRLRDILYNSHDYCLVVAHRGDWRNAPENSLQAFKNCIDMDVDMVELDLKMTKDSVLILCHDNTLDRTTTAHGYPSDYTFEELRKNYKLKSGHDIATQHDIPTLEEALNLCKGKILINIDKGYDYFQQVYELLVKTGTLEQVVIKSGNTLRKVQQDNPGILDKVIYMPVISLDEPGAEQMIDDYATIHPVAVECNFKTYTPEVERLLKKVQTYGMKVWVNSLWPSLNAGHYDDMAVEEERANDSWGWLLQRGALLIQTDRPRKLIAYLKQNNLHQMKKSLSPTLVSSSKMLNDAFQQAVWTIDNNTGDDKLLRAGANYGGEWTRDISMNSWNCVSQLRPDVAEYSLWSVTNDHRTIGHQYWDKIIWTIAAWNHYLVNGDEKFLREAYDCCKATMKELEDSVFDTKYGMFMGPAVFQDGIAAYEEPIYDQRYDSLSFVLDHPNAAPMKCLSTNCTYYEAYLTLAEMAKQLGTDADMVALYNQKAEALKKAILANLYDPVRHHFNYLIDYQGHVHDFQEALGIAYAVLFGVIDKASARKVLDACEIGPHGIVCVWPIFRRNTPEKPGRHNTMVWPHVNMYYASACAKVGEKKQFWFEMNNLADLVMNYDPDGEPNFHEIYTMDGIPSGGWQCSHLWDPLNHQTWCATGYIRNFMYYIIGMQPTVQGLTFAPMGMEDGSEVSLKDVPYRNAMLNITVRGNGSKIKRCTINGKKSKPFLPADAQGTYDIVIEL